VILGAITSNLKAATGPFDYIIKDWQAAGLRFASAFKPVMFTLEPTRIIARIGTLSPLDLTDDSTRIRRALEL
jgi:hypothetical protein